MARNIERITIAEAKERAAEWEAQYEECQRSYAIAARFQDTSPSEVIEMWQSQTNEKGRKLTQFEFEALIERWLELFGRYPPNGEELNGPVPEQPSTTEPMPEDDTMLRIGEVVRLTGISGSTMNRMVLDGRFPKPMRLSPRRIGWPAREVKAWKRQLDDQRRAPRQ